jgi:hypothetical protein
MKDIVTASKFEEFITSEKDKKSMGKMGIQSIINMN